MLKKWGQMNVVTAERFNTAGALVVKRFGQPSNELSELETTARVMRADWLKLIMLQVGFGSAMTLGAALAIMAVYGIGGHALLQHSLSVGGLVALAAYVQRLYQPVLDLASTRVNLAQQLVSFDRVFEVLDLPHAISDKPGAEQLQIADGEVIFEDVGFRYPAPTTYSLKSLEADEAAELSAEPSDWSLRDINLSLPAGRMTAAVAPSG